MKINLVVKHFRIVVDKIKWVESFFKLFQSCLNAGQLLVWLKDMINAVSSCLVFNLSLLHVIHLSHLANRFLRLEGHLQKELMLEGIAVVAVSVHKCWDYFIGPELRGSPLGISKMCLLFIESTFSGNIIFFISSGMIWGSFPYITLRGEPWTLRLFNSVKAC